MFARCLRGLPKRIQGGCALSPLTTSPRFTSSVPERTRKLPKTQRSSFSRVLHEWVLNRWFLVGFVSGVAAHHYFANSRNDSFAKYVLTAKEPVSSTASIFHLKPPIPPQSQEVYNEAWRRGIWNVQFKQPQLQIVRAYTPLPPIDETSGKDKDVLRFLIRHDPHGEVSSYLHRLPTDAEIELRGPYLEYEITPEVQQVVFFAGGTGIAPALQLAHALFEGNESGGDTEKNKDRKLHILWANRVREDCLGGVSDDPPAESAPPKSTWSGLFSAPKAPPILPPSDEEGPIVGHLESLKQRYPGQVTVEYFVNAEDTWIDADAVSRALSRFDDKNFSGSPSPSSGRYQILISGPPGFIANLAGPKEWRNGREEQGAVGKTVAHAISRNPHDVKVWKI